MKTTSQKLAGKSAIVTGASKGIGVAIAKHLAAEGASVVVNYASSKEGADRVVKEITEAGGKAVAVQADMSKPEDIDRLVSEAVKAFGGLNILVNNAGIFDFAPLEEVTPDHFHKQFNINVLGLILATQKALPHLEKAGGGSVINISSVAGVHPPPTASVYSATKGAVDTITKSLSKELGGRKIRVNSLNPGMIETKGFHSKGIAGSDFHKQIETQTPLGRIGQPDDIGPVAVFLASDDSGWITGETILVSGGQH